MQRLPRILFLSHDDATARVEALRSGLERSALARLQVWTPSLLPRLEERQVLLARGVLLERRRARGWDEVRAAAALTAPQMRALVALVQRDCDALVLDAGVDRTPLLPLLESAPSAVVTDLWLGRPEPSPAALTFGWVDWPMNPETGGIATALTSASGWLADFCNRSTVPLLIRFAGGNDPQEQQVERLHQTLAARCAAVDLPLYSPLFFDQGRLQAGRLLEAVRKRLGSDGRLPVLVIPQLGREEFSRRLRAEGGAWQGCYLAGAERPLVCLDAGMDHGEAAGTVERLARYLQRGRTDHA